MATFYVAKDMVPVEALENMGLKILMQTEDL